MLKVSGIDVFYGDLQVLWDVSFEVRDKEILVLVGANGAGKSTTLKTISGLLTPRKGAIEFDGVRLDQLPPDKVIGRGLMALPKVLMFDEPSLGLSPILVQDVFEIAKRINREGVTVMLVEQNVRQTLAMCDRAYVLENGRVVLEGTGKDLMADPHVKEAYLGI